MNGLGPFSGYGRRVRSANSVLHLGSTPGSTKLIAAPPPPRKTECPGHIAGRDALGRYPIGDCGTDCLMRRHRLGLAEWDGERWR